MAKKTLDQVLGVLTKLLKGKVEADDLDKVEEALEALELPDSDGAPAEDEVVIKRTDLRGLKDDLKTLRGKKNALQDQVTELEEAQESGEKIATRKAKVLTEELNTLKPLADKLLTKERARWTEAEGKLDEKVGKKFHKPEEGAELSIDQLLENTARLDDYVELGLVDLEAEPAPGEEKPTPPGAPRVPAGKKQGEKFTQAQLDEMTPAQKVEAGYTNLTLEQKRGT